MRAARKVPAKDLVPTPPGECGDPARFLLYDRVLRYFEPKVDEKMGAGTCNVCGKEIVGFAAPGSAPTCPTQRSITRNRPRAAEGEPVAFGSPLHGQSVKNHFFGLGCIVLVEPERSYVACNVIPVEPLPDTMTAVPVEPGCTIKFFKAFLESPPKVPFLLLVADMKPTSALQVTHSLSRMVICGGSRPVIVDFRAVKAAVAAVEKFGAKDFDKACRLRGKMQSTNPRVLADAIAEQKALQETHPAIDVASLESFPLPGSDEYAVLSKAVDLKGNREVEAESHEAA